VERVVDALDVCVCGETAKQDNISVAAEPFPVRIVEDFDLASWLTAGGTIVVAIYARSKTFP
jgi:hypothetical protein